MIMEEFLPAAAFPCQPNGMPMQMNQTILEMCLAFPINIPPNV